MYIGLKGSNYYIVQYPIYVLIYFDRLMSESRPHFETKQHANIDIIWDMEKETRNRFLSMNLINN